MNVELLVLNGAVLMIALTFASSRDTRNIKSGVVLGLLVWLDVLMLAYESISNMILILLPAFIYSILLYKMTKNMLSFIGLLKIMAPWFPFASLSLLLAYFPSEKILSRVKKGHEAISQKVVPSTAKSIISADEDY